MPELPEVEALRRYLVREGVPGRVVVGVDVEGPAAARSDDGMGGLAGLAGRRVADVRRHGKQLILPLGWGDARPTPRSPSPLRQAQESAQPRPAGAEGDGRCVGSAADGRRRERHFSASAPQNTFRTRNGALRSPSLGPSMPAEGEADAEAGFLGLHMGMTGRLVVLGPEDEPLRYTRTTLHLEDGRRLELDDARRWASVRLVEDAEELVGGLGPDALDPGFTADTFIQRVQGRRAPIKSVLLDQHVLAGVGNIYADEALLRVGIAPARRAHRISETRLRTLHGTIVTVLKHALDFILALSDERGRPFVVDTHDDRMRITRRKGAACPQCGAAQKSRPLGARTAYYCSRCQH